MMEYPHYPYWKSSSHKSNNKEKVFRPKMIVYLAIAVSAGLHYFIGFSLFTYIAMAFMGYAAWKLFSCGCWKAQIRFVAAVLMLLLASGFVWKPLFSLSIAILMFEMFV